MPQRRIPSEYRPGRCRPDYRGAIVGLVQAIADGRAAAASCPAYEELAEAVQFFGSWRILPYSVAAIACYDRLKALKTHVRKTDLRIAAVTLEHSGILVTRNLRDFRRIPNLIVEDWAV